MTTASITTRIVSAFVMHNAARPDSLPQIIQSVADAIEALSQPLAPTPAEAPALVPAVAPRKSVKPDAIICLDCGRPMKTLKRHLRTEHELTPEAYRQRWSLAADYPMVAPAYATARSDMAKRIGLGRKPDPKPAAKVKPKAARTKKANA
jgi:predicted transcriptional regulator